MFFAKPFEVLDRFEKPTNIAAVSWTRIWNAATAEQKLVIEDRVRLAHADTVGSADAVIEQMDIDVAGLALTIYMANESPGDGYPSVLPMHLTPWYFGMEYQGNEVDVHGKPTGASWWWRIVQVIFRLMQQRLATKHLYRPDRNGRRQASTQKFPDSTEIVVVRLRHEDSTHDEPSGDSANYSHRFIVGGHWRNQWYPAANVHRQIWISPYVKGDPGLPLIVRPRRVFQWTR